MDLRDLFVGSLAIAMGGGLIAVAAINAEAPFRLPKLRWLESKIGRSSSRGVLAVLGAGLVVLGILIARGNSLYGD